MKLKTTWGPVSILRGKNAKTHVKFASSVTLRYSDAPKNQHGTVLVKNENSSEEISAESAIEESYIKFRM